MKLKSCELSERLVHITSACSSTAHALSVCMNTRASYFIMQTAITCTATEAGVRLKAKNMVTVGTKQYTHKLLLAA